MPEPGTSEILAGLAGPAASAAFGAGMRIAGNQRRLSWKESLVELPTIGSMTMIGAGLAQHFNLAFYEMCGVCTFLTWAGPRVLWLIVDRLAPTRAPKVKT